ncbi:hypothetical protein [Duffyella gerundensis]|uniref:hypothetical protein n=1 Tax=Duffyella TaxID=3026546 RepID=UPI003F6E198C
MPPQGQNPGQKQKAKSKKQKAKSKKQKVKGGKRKAGSGKRKAKIEQRTAGVGKLFARYESRRDNERASKLRVCRPDMSVLFA